jgi:molybdenum-dependent DNA-binding transcriptional regulator ModE
VSTKSALGKALGACLAPGVPHGLAHEAAAVLLDALRRTTSINEAADLLGVSRRQIRVWLAVLREKRYRVPVTSMRDPAIR